jgi:glucosamine kinase
MTPLLQQVLEDFGGIEGIIRFGNQARPVDFAELAPRIVRSDDPAARRVFDGAVADVRHILTVLQGGAPLPVVFVGGLGPAYAARLTDWPQRPALGSGVDGALLMARQMAGAA